jgi:hypothetical protein
MTTNKMIDAIPDLQSKVGFELLAAIIGIDPKFYFKDWTVQQMIDGGVRIPEATKVWSQSYGGDSTFVKDVAGRLSGDKMPTLKQARALLNVCLKETRDNGGLPASSAAPVEPTPAPAPVLPYQCYTCTARFATYHEVMDHKAKAHPFTHKCRACSFTTTDGDAFREHRKEHYKPLFEDVPQSHLDLRSLIPTGRYAVPDLDGGSKDYIFLTVREVPKTHMRTKKYRYGWVQYGSEEVAKGTLEIRRHRGDTKELVGECRPGENYRGDHVREFELIVRDPTAATKLFGKLMGCCGRCGKSLTDPESRKQGIGPECIKHFRNRNGGTVPEAEETPDILRARILADAVVSGILSTATPNWARLTGASSE